MKNAFIFKNDTAHKFWRIDYSGKDFAVNYGKYDTIGKYEIKEFDSEEECKKKAENLIKQKLKKGYMEDKDFDWNSCIYIDDYEYGLHLKTSHPAFVAHFTEDFYYDCADEEAPFGSDEGSDALGTLVEKIRRNPKLDFLDFPRKLIEDMWEMHYIPATNVSVEETKLLWEKDREDLIQSDMVTYAIAFAQIKTIGTIDERLKNLALNSIKRYHIGMGAEMGCESCESSEIAEKMIEDLSSFQG